MKKVLSLVLCLALMATMFVMPAVAEDTYREPITLTVFSGLANYAGEQQGWFAKELKDRFNVTLKYISTNVATPGRPVYLPVNWATSSTWAIWAISS